MTDEIKIQSYYSQIDDKSMLHVAAIRKGTFVGSCFVQIEFAAAYLQDFSVAEIYQKQGIGSEILEHIIERCRENEKDSISLVVQSKNKELVSFYYKRGFISSLDYEDGTFLMTLPLK